MRNIALRIPLAFLILICQGCVSSVTETSQEIASDLQLLTPKEVDMLAVNPKMMNVAGEDTNGTRVTEILVGLIVLVVMVIVVVIT